MSQTPPPTVDTLPPNPTINSPSTFAVVADTFLQAFATFRSQLVSLGSNIYNNAVDCYNNAVLAVAAAADARSAAIAAAAASAAAKWVSGTTYADGDVTWSPANHLPYRRIGAGAGTTDPSNDAAHWAVQLSGIGLGGLALTGSVSLTNSSPGCVTVTPSQSGLFAIMPDATTLAKHLALFGIYNAGDVDYGIRDYAGNKLGWIAPKSHVIMGLVDNSTAAGLWTARGARKTGVTALFDSVAVAAGNGTPLQRITIDANRTAFVFGLCYLIVYDESSLSWGAPVLIRAADFCSVILSGPSQLLAFTSNAGTALEAVTITISGTSLTVNSGSKATATAANTVNAISAMIAVGTSWVVGYHTNVTGDSFLRGITISGTTPAFGSPVTLPNNSIAPPVLFASGAVVRAVHHASSGAALQCDPYTVAGSALTTGTGASTTAGGGASLTYLRAFMNSNGNIVAQYVSASGHGNVAVFKLTGTVEAVSAVQVSTSGVTPQVSTDYTAISGTKTLFSYLVPGSSGARFNIHTDTAGTGAAGTELVLAAFNASQIAALALAGSTARVGTKGSTDTCQFEIDCSGTSPLLASAQTADLNIGLPAPCGSSGLRDYTLLSAGGTAYSIGGRAANESAFSSSSIRAITPTSRDTYATGAPGAAASESWSLENNVVWATTIKRIEACA